MHCSYVAQHSSRHRLRHSPRVSWRRPGLALSQRAAQPAKHWRYLCGNQPVRRVYSPSHFSAMTRPSWLGRAMRNRYRHAIEQASRRWRGSRRADSARTRHKILIPHRQVRAVLFGALRVTFLARPVGVLAGYVCFRCERWRRRGGRRGGSRASDETSSRRQRHIDAARGGDYCCE